MCRYILFYILHAYVTHMLQFHRNHNSFEWGRKILNSYFIYNLCRKEKQSNLQQLVSLSVKITIKQNKKNKGRGEKNCHVSS